MIGKIHIENSPELSSIPKGNYEGYVWMSDQDKPEILNGQDIPRHIGGQSFIQEALLWDADKGRSVHVRHVGQIQVVCYDLKDKHLNDEVSFLSHRMGDHKRLMFKRTWEEEKDPACADMEVLVPGELIFVGFGN